MPLICIFLLRWPSAAAADRIGALASCQTLFGDSEHSQPGKLQVRPKIPEKPMRHAIPSGKSVPALELYRATPNLGSRRGGLRSVCTESDSYPATVELDGQLLPNVEVKSSTELSFLRPHDPGDTLSRPSQCAIRRGIRSDSRLCSVTTQTN